MTARVKCPGARTGSWVAGRDQPHLDGHDGRLGGALQPLVARQCRGGGFGIVYCLRTADKASDTNLGGFSFLQDLQAKERADERTRTADLLITSDNSCVAGVCTGLQFPYI
jgi:hypothetical protein